jgi:hypothetical protein
VQAVPSSPRAASSTPQAGAAAAAPYQPPLHGTNPHAQGTVATVFLAPTATRPLAGNLNGGPETIILGRARGEPRSNGTDHGHITILALLGNEILGVDTIPGQSVKGPLDAAQTAILNNLCTSTGGLVCVNAVTADSATTATGSTNHFEVAKANLAVSGAGVPAVGVDAANSNGNISSNGTCQTAHSDSSVANLTIAGNTLAKALQSSSDTKTCNNGTSTAPTATSKVVQLSTAGLPIPAPGCANGTPNTATGIPLLLPIVCNADDTSTNQTTIPYNVREALTILLLNSGGNGALANITTAAAESAAVAPSATTATGTTATGTTATGTTATGTTATGTTATGTTATGTTATGTTATGTTATGTTATGTTATGSTATGATGATSTGSTSTGEDTGEGATSTGATSTGATSTGEDTSTGATSTGDDTSTGATSTGTEGEPGETPGQPEEGTTGGAATAASSLPFTGYDVTGAVLLGLFLLVAGFGGRRVLAKRARRTSS